MSNTSQTSSEKISDKNKLRGVESNKTFMLKGSLRQPYKWYIVDASGKVVGRLASQIAKILMGKHKPTYTPHLLCGDKIIVINASKVVFTGNKIEKKVYQFYSGYPGGLKEVKAKTLFEKNPEKIIYLAVKRMLPDNKLRKYWMRNLYIYRDDKHPHHAHKPEEIKL